MPTTIQCRESFPLSAVEVEALWGMVRGGRQQADDDIIVRCVTENDIQELNQRYHQQQRPTNVLTFTYDQDIPGVPATESKTHDVAVCLKVARKEARALQLPFKDYVAWLLTHAFFHVTGMDHERSETEAHAMDSAERGVLRHFGYSVPTL